MQNEPCPLNPCHEAKVIQSPEDLAEVVFADEPHHVGAGFAGSPDPDPDGDLIDAIEAEEAREAETAG